MECVAVIGIGGIGAAVARRLMGQVEHLVLGWHEHDQVVRELSEQGPAAPASPAVVPRFRAEEVATVVHGVQIDVCDPESCKDLFTHARKYATRPSAVVNCFGSIAHQPGLRNQPQLVHELLADNLLGVINVSRPALLSLMKRGGGAIVNVGSAVTTSAVPGLSAYAASKAGVVAYTRSIAVEAARFGVTCNTVSPGFIDCGPTAAQSEQWRAVVAEQIPSGRLGQADEVAALIQFLVSPWARYLTGQEFIIDGGWSLGSMHMGRELQRLASS